MITFTVPVTTMPPNCHIGRCLFVGDKNQQQWLDAYTKFDVVEYVGSKDRGEDSMQLVHIRFYNRVRGDAAIYDTDYELCRLHTNFLLQTTIEEDPW